MAHPTALSAAAFVAAISIVVAGCGSPPRAVPEDSGTAALDASAPPDGSGEIAMTSAGAVYTAVNCRSVSAEETLIVFLPGTGTPPGSYSLFVSRVGAATSRCVIAIRYDNSESLAGCCAVTEDLDGPQAPDCLQHAISAKVHATPSVYTCMDEGAHEVTRERSIEGRVRAALEEIDIRTHLDDSDTPRWRAITIAGHSQGALLASFIAMARHECASIASIAGGSLPTTDGYLAYVTGAPLTPPSRHRALHHASDADQPRRQVYELMGLAEGQIRAVEFGGPCVDRPHACIAIDPYVPERGGEPVFAGDWMWATNP